MKLISQSPMNSAVELFSPDEVTMLWFDLDDTLWDMAGNSVLCLRELYDTRGLSRYFDSPEHWDEVYHRINGGLWEQYSRSEITRDYLRSERFARPLRLAGVGAGEAAEMAAEFDVYYLQLLGAKTRLMPGAAEILTWLRERGYRMGIVSNGFREVQYNKLRSGGIDSFFDIVVLSDDAGYNKPDRRFFTYAEEQAGSADGLNVIIGDNPVTDIKGALEAGWRAVWYDPGRKDDGAAFDGGGQKPVARIEHLGQLRDLF